MKLSVVQWNISTMSQPKAHLNRNPTRGIRHISLDTRSPQPRLNTRECPWQADSIQARRRYGGHAVVACGQSTLKHRPALVDSAMDNAEPE